MKRNLFGAVFLSLISVNLYAQAQDISADTNPTTPATQQPSSDPTPVTQTPAVQPQTPAVQPQAPAVQPQAPAVQPQAPAVQPQAPAVQPQAPAVQPQAPAAQQINCEYNIPPETETIENALVLQWAKYAASKSFDFDHTNLDQQISTLEACYTEQGWKGFNEALEKSGNLNAIKTQNLMVSSQLSGSAEISEIKENQWKVTLPLQVVYKNDKETLTQLLTVTLNIGRKTNGNLGIMQLIAVPKPKTSEGQAPIQNNQPAETN